jgi:fatty acid amide hydrolase 2
VHDLLLPLVKVCPQQRAAIRLVERKLRDRFQGTPVRVLHVNLSDPATLPHPAWSLMSQTFRMWSAVMDLSDEVTFTALMGESYRYDPSAGRFRPGWEMLKWIVGKSRHTFPAIALCLVEKLNALLPASVRETQVKRLYELQRAMHDVLGSTGVLVLPTYPVAPPRHNDPLRKHLFAWCYTGLFNALELPSCAVPVWLPSACSPDDPASGPLPTQNLPLGVQCVANWACDHNALWAAQELERLLGARREPLWVAPLTARSDSTVTRPAAPAHKV